MLIFGGVVSWHSAEAVTQPIWLDVWGFSELLVKLEISLTLSGEIDNSNVKRVEEVSVIAGQLSLASVKCNNIDYHGIRSQSYQWILG